MEGDEERGAQSLKDGEDEGEVLPGEAGGSAQEHRADGHAEEHRFLVADHCARQGGVTLLCVCPHCHRVPLEDYVWWVSLAHGGSVKSKKSQCNWWCAACVGQVQLKGSDRCLDSTGFLCLFGRIVGLHHSSCGQQKDHRWPSERRCEVRWP